MRLMFSFILIGITCALHASTPTITPPKGWDCIEDPEQLPQKVNTLFVGSGKGQFSPSINIACEKTTLQITEYLTQAKKYHEAQGDTRCKLLGTIETKAGPANLLQIDRPTQWGNIRFIQAVVMQNEEAFVITATCLREEFAQLSSNFFKSIQTFSLH